MVVWNPSGAGVGEPCVCAGGEEFALWICTSFRLSARNSRFAISGGRTSEALQKRRGGWQGQVKKCIKLIQSTVQVRAMRPWCHCVCAAFTVSSPEEPERVMLKLFDEKLVR